MPTISHAALQRKQATLVALEEEFREWRPHYQELGKYFLPRRYQWLSAQSPLGAANSGRSQNAARRRNEYILDATGTKAARTLAAGMMNGIASPARPWFSFRFAGFPDTIADYPVEVQRYLDELERRVLVVLAESNFYNALAVTFLDLAVFGTSATLIYPDFEKVIRFYNSPVGEFRLTQDDRRIVTGYARSFHMTTAQIISRWGEANVSEIVQGEWKRGGTARQQSHTICHLIEENSDDDDRIGGGFASREVYWEKRETRGKVLSIAGFRVAPGIFPRWELVGNDTYGTSPGMDALPDVIQLQHETKAKAMSLDYMNRPPIVADNTFKQKPGALLPGGRTFVPSSSQAGAKPVYTVSPPINEMSQDIASVQASVRETFHNDLFRMISQLDTVRSATEIDARREEKLVLLGPVLERFENEALDPALQITVSNMRDADLLPPPPPGFENEVLDIRYVSVLSDAQRAVGTASMERFMEVIGNTAAAVPEVLGIPKWDALLREYARRLNVPAVGIKSADEVAAEAAAQQEQLAAQQAAVVGEQLTSAAKNLSETDVGGGQNAVQALLGG